MEVIVAVGVIVGVLVGVPVEEIEVGVDVLAETDVGVNVFVEAGIAVGVRVGGIITYGSVLVGVLVGKFACVGGTGVEVEVGTGVSVAARVGMTAPGVRNVSLQTGWVRMAGSMTSTISTGRLVGLPSWRSRLDLISAFSFQRGENWSAHCPASSTHKSPNRMMMKTISQSRRSCSTSFIGLSVDGQPYKDCCAGKGRLVKAGTFKPDAPSMSIDNTAGDSKSQAGSATLELGLA